MTFRKIQLDFSKTNTSKIVFRRYCVIGILHVALPKFKITTYEKTTINYCRYLYRQ